MTTPEKLELSLILLAPIAAYFLGDLIPSQWSIGLGVIWLASITFIQSLIRDLSLLSLKLLSSSKGKQPNVVESRCLCLESLAGVSLLLIGFLLFFVGNTHIIVLSDIAFSVVLLFTLVMGFLIKDLVVFWKPLQIRREKGHMNIIVKW